MWTMILCICMAIQLSDLKLEVKVPITLREAFTMVSYCFIEYALKVYYFLCRKGHFFYSECTYIGLMYLLYVLFMCAR